MKFPSVVCSVIFFFDIAWLLAAEVLLAAGKDGPSALHSSLHCCLEVACKVNLPQPRILRGGLCRIRPAKSEKYVENVQTPIPFGGISLSEWVVKSKLLADVRSSCNVSGT